MRVGETVHPERREPQGNTPGIIAGAKTITDERST